MMRWSTMGSSVWDVEGLLRHGAGKCIHNAWRDVSLYEI